MKIIRFGRTHHILGVMKHPAATLLLLLSGACRPGTALGPSGPDAYVWKLSSSAEPAAGGGFTLAHLGDYIAGEYCEHCLAPEFRRDWCDGTGTGPGWQVRNVEPYTGARRGWVYVGANRSAPGGYYADVCHDSTGADLTTALQHTNDSAAGVIHVRSYAPASQQYHTFTLTGSNRTGSAFGFVYASGCAADSTLLWSVADTSGTVFGPFGAPGSVPDRPAQIVADEGALRFVREGFKPQCIPAADRLEGAPALTAVTASRHWLRRDIVYGDARYR